PIEELESYDRAMKALCGGDTRGWGPAEVAHRRSGLRIRTGQLFTIRADKPEDLPSMELLQIQWNLKRIAAMSGAADVYEDLEDDDFDHDGNYAFRVYDSEVDDEVIFKENEADAINQQSGNTSKTDELGVSRSLIKARRAFPNVPQC
ncbi:hypothetical protein SEPCBS57363_006534, partial [Sporothrix epigloea]